MPHIPSSRSSSAVDLGRVLFEQQRLAEFVFAVARLAQEAPCGSEFHDHLMPGFEAIGSHMADECARALEAIEKERAR